MYIRLTYHYLSLHVNMSQVAMTYLVTVVLSLQWFSVVPLNPPIKISQNL